MERQIVVITTGIRSSPKKIPAAFHAMDLRGALCAKPINKMFFLVGVGDSEKVR